MEEKLKQDREKLAKEQKEKEDKENDKDKDKDKDKEKENLEKEQQIPIPQTSNEANTPKSEPFKSDLASDDGKSPRTMKSDAEKKKTRNFRESTKTSKRNGRTKR